MLNFLENLFRPGDKKKRIDVTFTEEELEAIQKHGEQINSFAPNPGQVLYVVPEMVNPLKALALVQHVAKRMAFAYELPETATGPLLDKVIATQAKAYALHELPYYLYLWAALNQAKGDTASAKRLFGLFLKFQAEFRPGKVDQFIIKLLELESWYDVEKAEREARAAISQEAVNRDDGPWAMLTWLKQLFGRRSAEGRAAEILAAAQGTEFERCAIVGLMTAIEAEEVVKHRATVKPEHEMNFLMAYECLMMWAIKNGMEGTLSAKDTESAVLAMQRHVTKNAYYQAGAFEQIWVTMQSHMPWAMTQQPDGPRPYPMADMLIAAKLAGCEIAAKTQEFFDLKFGIYVAIMMAKLAEATKLAAKDLQRPPA